MAEPKEEKSRTLDGADLNNPDGSFGRKASEFRSVVSAEPGAEFSAEKGRYVLYLNLGCPWAHRANIVYRLKGLEDVIQLVVMGHVLTSEGWIYDGKVSSAPSDPIHGFTKHSQLYFLANPSYSGRYTVPVLWDTVKSTIVNNESSEIIRMLYTAFDAFIPSHLRESSKQFLPADKKNEIEEMNEWVYDKINNGVYKCGFATSQIAYNQSIYALFESLDRVEAHLEKNQTPYLFGDHITEADIRLFPTIVRFDAAYVTGFKCNLKMIRYDYPKIHEWLKRIYWDEGAETNGGAFKKTTGWVEIKEGYTAAVANLFGGQKIVPAGPLHNVMPLLG